MNDLEAAARRLLEQVDFTHAAKGEPTPEWAEELRKALPPRFELRDEAFPPALTAIHEAVHTLLARRPTCPLHGIPCEPEPPSLGRGDPPWGDPGFTDVQRITMTWRCPHPDHQPPKCAGCGLPPNAHSPTRTGGYLTGHAFVLPDVPGDLLGRDRCGGRDPAHPGEQCPLPARHGGGCFGDVEG